MRLDEAKEILKKAGYLVEDTDDWDDADLPAGMTQKQRRDWARKHNATLENDFRKFGEKRWEKEDDFENYYGKEVIDDDDAELNGEGRRMGNKIERGKYFNMSPETNPFVAEVFDLLKKSGWKYIGDKTGDEKNRYISPEEKFFYFKKPGRGKKDYIIGFCPDPDGFEGKGKRRSIHISFTSPSTDGGGSFTDAADFVKEMNYSYSCDIKEKRPYHRHDEEPDYEEMAALAYEDQ